MPLSDDGDATGPFCLHWSELGDCDEACLNPACGHRCDKHSSHEGWECRVEGCECQGIWYKGLTGEIVKWGNA